MTIICHEKYKKDYNCKIKYINEILRIALTNNLSPTSYSLVRNAYFPPPVWSAQQRILWLATTDLKVLKSFKVMICPGDLLLRSSIRQLSTIITLKKILWSSSYECRKTHFILRILFFWVLSISILLFTLTWIKDKKNIKTLKDCTGHVHLLRSNQNESHRPSLSSGGSHGCSWIKVKWPNHPYVRATTQFTWQFSNVSNWHCQSNSTSNQTCAGCEEKTFFRFLCSECVDEMHKLGHMVKMGAVYIHVRGTIAYIPFINGKKKAFGWHLIDAVVNSHRTTSGTHTAPLLATTSTSAERAFPDTMSACW